MLHKIKATEKESNNVAFKYENLKGKVLFKYCTVKVIFFSIIFLFVLKLSHTQNKILLKNITLNEKSIVKDSAGTIYPATIWQRLLITGSYSIKPVNPNDEKTEFIITRVSEKQRQKNLQNLPKPKESKFFKTGQSISSFSRRDLNGEKFRLKDLKGKIVVLNFWFINCPPCRYEIPELNKIVQEYKDSTNVVFIAIAMDKYDALKEFLRITPFNYHIIDDGRYIAEQNGVTSFPTHVVLDKRGKAYFHTTGLSTATALWLRKSIDELLSQ